MWLVTPTRIVNTENGTMIWVSPEVGTDCWELAINQMRFMSGIPSKQAAKLLLAEVLGQAIKGFLVFDVWKAMGRIESGTLESLEDKRAAALEASLAREREACGE